MNCKKYPFKHFKDNAPHKNIAYEDFLEDTTYAISISPMVQYQNQNDRCVVAQQRIESFIHTFSKNYLPAFALVAKTHLHLELSSLGNLHYHGTIKVNKTHKLQWYAISIPILKNNGTFEIDTITDPIIWDEYCNKQKLPYDYICPREIIHPPTGVEVFLKLKKPKNPLDN